MKCSFHDQSESFSLVIKEMLTPSRNPFPNSTTLPLKPYFKTWLSSKILITVSKWFSPWQALNKATERASFKIVRNYHDDKCCHLPGQYALIVSCLLISLRNLQGTEHDPCRKGKGRGGDSERNQGAGKHGPRFLKTFRLAPSLCLPTEDLGVYTLKHHLVASCIWGDLVNYICGRHSEHSITPVSWLS